jgi:hypothetical protein
MMDAAMILTKTSRKERSSDYELTRNVISEAKRAVTARQTEIQRAERCWKMYFAANGGQWDDADKATLRKEFRHAAQFNVVGPKIDALAGALLADLPDISWSPVEGQASAVTEAIAESYFADKDLYDYDDKILKVFKAGLVHSGDAYMCMDYTQGMPRIKLINEEPGFIIWAPNWQTANDRDAKTVYRIRYLNAEDLILNFNHKSEEILAAVIAQNRNPAEYPTNAANQKRQLQGKVGDEYKVIEKHYIKHVKGKRLLGRREGSEQWIPFPADKDEYYLSAFGEANQIDWTTVVETKYEDRIHYYTTVCEELNELLTAEQKSEVQVNGLPFFHFSAKRLWGEDAGFVDDIVDLQQTINKRESLITELISKANGGSMLVDQNLFLDETKRAEWIKNKNKPGHAEFVDLSSTPNPLMHIAGNQYPTSILDQINRMYSNVLPLISRASDALSSITESGDSGILFERKFQLNMISNTLLNRNVRQFMNNVGEAYFFQWQNANRDLMREVQFRDGRRITLNEPNECGMICNAVSEVPRCRVVVTENTKSQTFQMRYRGLWGEVLRSIPADAAPGHFMFVLKKFFETLQLTDEDKENLEILNEIMLIQARVMGLKNLTALQTGIQGDTLQSAQIQMQLEQLAQQQAAQGQQQQIQQMGMGGGGMPQGGAEGAYPVQLPPAAYSEPPQDRGGMLPEGAAASIAAAGANRPMGGQITDMARQMGAPV